jgi:branched-chain amino acid transport system ATP-binding protein
MILEMKDVETGYQLGQVLFGVTLDVKTGQCVSLLGRNGMGKSTIIKTIMGELKLNAGIIRRFGKCHDNKEPFQIASEGIGLVPEGRQIFPNLTVKENLVTFYKKPNERSQIDWQLEKIIELFPRLKDRLQNLGSQLSGGEQQMLAIGRALMTNPKFLILDEATEGLAPIVREQIWESLNYLKTNGFSILVVDKDISALSELADHHYILEKGKVVWNGSSSDLIKNRDLESKYLGV